MAWVRTQGKYLRYDNDADYKAALAKGATPVSDQEIEQVKQDKVAREEAANHPLRAGAKGAFTGLVDMATAPARAAGGLLEGAVGQNPVSDATGQMTGENAAKGIMSIAADPFGNQTQAENDAAVERGWHQSQLEAQANPIASGLGRFGGGALGMGPAAKIAGALAPGAGTLATAAQGGLIGAQASVADAADQAHAQQSYLKGSEALASAGLGLLIGGSLSFAGKAIGGLFAKREAAELAGGLSGEAIAEPGPGDTLSGIPRAEDIPDLEPKPPLPRPKANFPGEPPSFTEPIDMSQHAESRFIDRGFPEPRGVDETPDLTAEGAGEDFKPAPRTMRAMPKLELNEAYDTEAMPHLPDSGDIQRDLKYGLAAEDMNMQARSAKVNKLLEAIPEGATPDYILGMTDAQKDAFSEFVLGRDERNRIVPISDATLKALADAVGERAAVHNPAEMPATVTEMPATQAPIQAQMPQEQGSLPPMQPGNALPPPDVGSFAPTAEPNLAGQPPKQLLENPDLNQYYAHPGLADTEQGALPATVNSPGEWNAYMDKIGRMAGRSAVRFAFGKALGPFGYAAGGAVYDRLGTMANSLKGLSSKAFDATIRTAQGIPTQFKQSVINMTIEKAFYGKDTAEAAYQKKLQELDNLNANNGQLLIDRIARSFGPLANYEPHAVLAVTESAQRGIDYLLQKAPTSPLNEKSLTPQASRPIPNRCDIDNYARIYTAVMFPKTVLASIANGTVTKDEIDAIRYVHPQWFQSHIANPAMKLSTSMDMNGEPFPPAVRRIMDDILGTSTGPESDEFTNQYGPQFTKAVVTQASPQQSSPTGRHLSQPSQLASNYQTQTSKFLGAQQ